MRSRFTRTISILLLFLVLPAATLGASVEKTLTTPDQSVVSRGEFIRASVQVLGMSAENKSAPTFTRVPKALIPYINAANDRGALNIFGNNLLLSRGITRGEALQVLVALQKLSPSGLAVSFSDVPEGTDLSKAVQIAVTKNWMSPVSANIFGADRALSGSEARLLLRKVIGEGIQQRDAPSDTTTVPSTVIKITKKKGAPTLPKDELLRTVWQLISEQYLYKDRVKDEDAAYAAAEALVKTLNDPYTVFLRPIPAKEFQDQIQGETSGIGAQVEYKDGFVVIIAPIPGAPADKAGLKGGDIILKADDNDLTKLGFAEAVNKIRGPKGSKVTLRIRRGSSEFDVTVERATVKVPEISISMNGSVAIVRLAQFGVTTDNELRSLLIDLQTKNPKGIVLDLRNNPGGLLHAAEATIADFLPLGSSVAHIISNQGDTEEKTKDPPVIDAKTPVIVLVNGGSASAAEIVAGALQDAGRATIVGEKTFGKGTVQQVVDFRDGSSLKMTIAEWKTPKNRIINNIGITPDVVVAQGDARDDQLERALLLLR